MSLLDSYDNPFRSPSPDANRYKRARPESDSEPEDLGIDEQVEVQKRARVPRIKLDEDRFVILPDALYDNQASNKLQTPL